MDRVRPPSNHPRTERARVCTVKCDPSYHFDWKTVEGVSRVLDKAARSEGVTVEESYAHRQTRSGAARTAERGWEDARTPRRQDRGLGM